MKAQKTINDASHRSAKITRRVLLLAIPPVVELDIAGPFEVFGTANKLIGKEGSGDKPYDIQIVTAAHGRTVEGASGLSLNAHLHITEVQGVVDTIVVSGGPGARGIRHANTALITWLQGMSSQVRRLCSVCTGAFVLAEAGLLDGKPATTHWRWANELAARYPDVHVNADPIWLQAGNIYTSAGITAGMDLALALVEEDFGNQIALEVARHLVMFLHRPGGQAQFSVALSLKATEKKSIQDLRFWITQNLAKNLSVDLLASHVAMSPRNFARVFTLETGMTPARYVEALRLEFARQQLENTDKSLAQIAALSGFGSAEVMRRAFLRVFQVSPNHYRKHFQVKRRS